MTNLIWNHAAIREPVEPEQVITMDREWQTRDGRKVTLYCVDAPGIYMVHGRIEGSDKPTYWLLNGTGLLDDESLIPAPDWREQIPWSALADWVQWVARGAEGRWRAFSTKPTWCVEWRWYLNVSGRDTALTGAIRMPEGPKDWREAIAQRPDSKGENQ